MWHGGARAIAIAVKPFASWHFGSASRSTGYAVRPPLDLGVKPRHHAFMAANLYIYCPANGNGLDRNDLEEQLEVFFSGAAEDCGAGSGATGFNLDYELCAGADPHLWADRLKMFLEAVGVRSGTTFDVFPDGWEPGREWRRVKVFGSDVWRIDPPKQA